MSHDVADKAIENYKGRLQQYCHLRNLEVPVYETVQCGTNPNEPSWSVTIRYGQSTYTIPEPIRGSKRLAEQMTAKQLLETFEARQEAFLAGQPLDQTPIEKTKLDSEAMESSPLPSLETLYPPIELVASALGIANHRLVELRRGTRFRESAESNQSNQEFAQDLARLTMMIVRELMKSAEEANVKLTSDDGESS